MAKKSSLLISGLISGLLAAALLFAACDDGSTSKLTEDPNWTGQTTGSAASFGGGELTVTLHFELGQIVGAEYTLGNDTPGRVREPIENNLQRIVETGDITVDHIARNTITADALRAAVLQAYNLAPIPRK